jgi:hypothetical protein
MEVPFGFCHCGCGKKTNIAKNTVPRWGFVKGQPYKFLCGHGRATKAVGSTLPPNPDGLCMCGCGRKTPLAIYTSHQTGNVLGEHRRYCVGHGSSYARMVVPENESGLCMCGCGKPTLISKVTRKERGYAAGQPENFLHNHHGRTLDYVVEDRGYKTPCWIWQKNLDKDGYGGASVNRKQVRAHRAYYEKYNGPIPEGYDVDHLCFVTSCVNPKHLEAVPPIVNQRRRRTTKLTVDAVQRIPELRSKGLSYAKIATLLGATAMAVYNAHIGRTWKGIGGSTEPPTLTASH